MEPGASPPGGNRWGAGTKPLVETRVVGHYKKKAQSHPKRKRNLEGNPNPRIRMKRKIPRGEWNYLRG